MLRTLAAATLGCLLLYGLVMGSFSGGVQWWAAPAKLVGGTLLSAVICLPSLYIFMVCLQMSTALRPFVGRAPTFLPTEKLFFCPTGARISPISLALRM